MNRLLPSALLLFAILCAEFSMSAQNSPGGLPRGTPEYWADPGWWPTKGTSTYAQYTGTASCSQCHAAMVDSQQTTPMAQAASKPTRPTNSLLSFADGDFHSALEHRNGAMTQTVTHGNEKTTADASWIFGAGEVAQTYIFPQSNQYLESRLSYYTRLGGVGITTGHAAEPPKSLAEAIGEPLDPEVIRRCFGCHSTASTVAGVFAPEHATLGVTCEACHGPGKAHVEAMRKTTPPITGSAILNPKRLSPVQSVDYCGACHRTSVDVAVSMQAELGVAAVRFQPYRLERSLCWGAGGDARITCVACHDPHKPLVRESVAYDATCLACHALKDKPQSEAAVRACKVSTNNCTSCHMPKVEVPAAHATFTDHFIRIVRPGTGFRN